MCSSDLVSNHLGVVRNTIYNWMGKGNAPLDKLMALQGIGADVNYILTGERAGAAPVLGVDQEKAGYSVEVLDKQEQALLDNFRHCPQDAKQQITESSALYSKLAKKRA